MFTIRIKNNQKVVKAALKRIKQTARRTLKKEWKKETDCELNIQITDDHEMAKLHWRYMRIRGTTDVMAFGMQEGEKIMGSSHLLGDVVLSAETAKKVAETMGISTQEEMERYMIHGILHLLGYRDHTPKKAKIMQKKQEELLKNAYSKN